MQLNFDHVVTQLNAFRSKNRSNLSADDLELLDDIIHQLRIISSISDASIRKDRIGKWCLDAMKFIGVKILIESL